VVNISAGGYCLRWNSDDTSRAQIGELIAIQEFDASGNFAWRIGVIRWMQFIRRSGLEIGVQVLSPKVFAAAAQLSHRPHEEPFECLVLPGIKPLKQPASVILPAHAFRPGDKLKITVMEEETTEIKLNSIREHTGSFTQFQYTSLAEAEEAERVSKQKTSEKNKDDFDEIWSSL
jgi:hypothetical protein